MHADFTDEPIECASPACFAGAGEGPGVLDAASQGPAGVRHWRRAERRRLLDLRAGIDATARRRHDRQICGHLAGILGNVAGLVVSGYSPIAGEPALDELTAHVLASGGRWALPVVVQRACPMSFRTWSPGEILETGFGGIPVPQGGETVVPDIVLAPVVGFDAGCFRLGYGGGYFDRTLAAAIRRQRALGVGYAQARIATIYPQPHDVPMDAVITQEGVTFRATRRPRHEEHRP